MVTATSNFRLTDRDVKTLDHIRTFRMTTLEILQRLLFPDQQIEAVKSWRRRVKHAGLIGGGDFIHPRDYIRLTPLAVQKLYGEAGEPLTPFTLARQYGILAFCCTLETLQRKLTSRDFCEKFPNLADGNHLPRDFYYVDKDSSQQRLGFIYIDHGRTARRIYVRYRDLVAKRFKLPDWRQEVINRDRFIMAVVTAKPEKKKRIEEVFREQRPKVSYRIEVVPDLIHLI